MELGVPHAVDLFLDVQHLLHHVNALVVVGRLGEGLAFLGELE